MEQITPMAIETLEDLIDQLADWVGVYGAHDTDEPRPGFSPELHCRVCFVSAMQTRIRAAANVEAIMRRVSLSDHAGEAK